MQVGLDIVTSANCKSQLQFGQTNNYQLLYITSTKYFQSAVVMGRRNSNSNLHKALSDKRTWFCCYEFAGNRNENIEAASLSIIC